MKKKIDAGDIAIIVGFGLCVVQLILSCIYNLIHTQSTMTTLSSVITIVNVILLVLIVAFNASVKAMDNPLVIKIKYLVGNVGSVEKIEKGDWIDLRASERVELKAGEFALIPLGIAMKLPKGYEAYIAPRSSTFKKWGIIQTNSIGIVDNSYCGNDDMWRMPVYATRDTVIEVNDRICQFRINKIQPNVDFLEVEELESVNRGGFGSTGSN